MSNIAKATTRLTLVQPDWQSKLDLVRRTVAVGATDDEFDLLVHQAKRAGLDPLVRQIYFVKRKGKVTIQVGIDGYRLIAHRTAECPGIDDAEYGPENDRGFPTSAKVTVWRIVQGQRCPFSSTARWDEYYPGDESGFQWRKMPHAMLGKCAEALALRKAFPAELSGIYVDAEMHLAGLGDSEPVAETLFEWKKWLLEIGFTKAQYKLYVSACEAKGLDPATAARQAFDAGCQGFAEVVALVDKSASAPASLPADLTPSEE